MKYIKMMNIKKPAFTMIELVFVIVVLGIIASLALPRLDRDLRQEAKQNILSAIRLTQHLALVDNKTVPGTAWQENLWNINFQSDGSYYTISSDGNAARDPVNGNLMDGAATDPSKNIFLEKMYSVDGISGGCTTVGFDNLGRPFTSMSGADYSGYMNSNCNILVTFEANIADLNITITAETGHVSSD